MPRPKLKLSVISSVSPDDYIVDVTMSRHERTADYLNWLALKFPKRYIKKQDLHKKVYCESRSHSESSIEIRNFVKGLCKAEKILQTKYGRKILNVKGKGIRATVDDDDLAAKAGVDYRRAKSAALRFKGTADMIDPAKVSSKPMSTWVKRAQEGSGLLLGICDKMLPPKSETINNV